MATNRSHDVSFVTTAIYIALDTLWQCITAYLLMLLALPVSRFLLEFMIEIGMLAHANGTTTTYVPKCSRIYTGLHHSIVNLTDPMCLV